MRLVALEPTFLRITSPGYRQEVDSLAEAQGIRFWCPSSKCQDNAHAVLCWFRDRGVSGAEPPGPGRWDVVSGTGYEDLSLSPSILITSGCMWHGFMRNGELVDAL